MKELAYETTDKQKKARISEWIMSLNFDRFRVLNNGSECDTGSENVNSSYSLLQNVNRIKGCC